MDIQAMFASQGYASLRPAMQPAPETPSKLESDVAGAARSFSETLETAETVAQQAMAGQSDPHALVGALAQSELAVNTVVAVRNKVVEAYQEILRMPV